MDGISRRSSLGAIAAMLLCGPALKQVAANQREQIAVIDVQKGTIAELPKGHEVSQPPKLRARFEGARQDEAGRITLRFGNGEHHNEMDITGMKRLSLRSVKRLAELTGTDASWDDISNALTE